MWQKGISKYTKMTQLTYKTQGTCSVAIDVELDDNQVIQRVQYHGGCSGNTQGIAKLVVGMKAEEAIARLEGIRCGFKSTSCPDQLSKALKQMIS